MFCKSNCYKNNFCFSFSGTAAAHSYFLPLTNNSDHDHPPLLGGKVLSFVWCCGVYIKFFYLIQDLNVRKLSLANSMT